MIAFTIFQKKEQCLFLYINCCIYSCSRYRIFKLTVHFCKNLKCNPLSINDLFLYLSSFFSDFLWIKSIQYYLKNMFTLSKWHFVFNSLQTRTTCLYFLQFLNEKPTATVWSSLCRMLFSVCFIRHKIMCQNLV